MNSWFATNTNTATSRTILPAMLVVGHSHFSQQQTFVQWMQCATDTLTAILILPPPPPPPNSAHSPSATTDENLYLFPEAEMLMWEFSMRCTLKAGNKGISRSQLNTGAWTVLKMKCCLMSSDVSWHIRDKLWPMPKHSSINLYVHGNQTAR